MADDELASLSRAVQDGPEDPATWVALARCLQRLDRGDPGVGSDLLPQLLAAWKAEPAERALERIFAALTGLDPVEGGEHDPRSGLPREVTRREDGAGFLLVPSASWKGVSRVRARTGYLRRDFHEEFAVPPGKVVRCDPEQVLQFVARTRSAYPWPEIEAKQVYPLSGLLGRHLAHGLTPEDCAPLPPPVLHPDVVLAPPEPPMPVPGGMPGPSHWETMPTVPSPEPDEATLPPQAEPDPPKGVWARLLSFFRS